MRSIKDVAKVMQDNMQGKPGDPVLFVPPTPDEVKAHNDAYIESVRAQVAQAYAEIDRFSYGHLDAAQVSVMRSTIKTARQWLKLTRKQPGHSMIISGPMGTGKSTLIAALSAALVDVYASIDHDNKIIDHSLVKRSRVYEAYEIMALVGQCKERGWDIAQAIGDRLKIYAVFIDDVGREGRLPYVPAGDDQTDERHNRYRLLLNHCKRSGIGVFMSSNAPIVGRGGSGFAPEFINAIGAQSFDMMLEMAPAGYMVDLFTAGITGYRAIKGGRS